jgi:AraC-like DNA-binding protein
VDEPRPRGQASPVEKHSFTALGLAAQKGTELDIPELDHSQLHFPQLHFPQLYVHVERGRALVRVVARTPEPRPSVLVEAHFSGGSEGIWFRLTQAGQARVYSRDAIARHPALSAVLRLIADEVDFAKPSSEALLTSLFRSLLVYVSRLATPVPLPRWGRPLRDARVEKALELLNADITKRWTVELLARAVGLSRPVFARQFLKVLGLTPMRYLTEKRMQIAAALLLGSDAALAEVAARVGYQSEFAFNRAFKRHYQVPPGVYRQRPPATLCVAYSLAA